MAAEGTITATGRAPADIPYRASWVDWLTRAIDRLPIPAWVFYALLLGALVVVVNAVSWSSGLPKYAPGTFDLFQSGYAVYPVYMLAMMHYLNRVAAEKLAAFRPALDVSEQQYERLRYELTTLPARETALVALAGFGFVAFLFVGDFLTNGLAPVSPAYMVAALVIQGVTIALLGVLIYHTLHQLRLVSRIHALAPRIDLFEPAPLYAFSQLTARTGLGLAILTAYSFLIDPSINPIGVGLTVLVVGAAAAAFVLPLEGMHRRIVAEKQLLLAEADRRLKVAIAELHASVDRKDLSVADAWNKMLDSLKIERDAISRMPTWPWEPGTLRAFVTALLVPIVLWLIIRGLERFI